MKVDNLDVCLYLTHLIGAMHSIAIGPRQNDSSRSSPIIQATPGRNVSSLVTRHSSLASGHPGPGALNLTDINQLTSSTTEPIILLTSGSATVYRASAHVKW